MAKKIIKRRRRVQDENIHSKKPRVNEGNPANLVHKGNPANLVHKGNPANLVHKGRKPGSKNKPLTAVQQAYKSELRRIRKTFKEVKETFGFKYNIDEILPPEDVVSNMKNVTAADLDKVRSITEDKIWSLGKWLNIDSGEAEQGKAAKEAMSTWEAQWDKEHEGRLGESILALLQYSNYALNDQFYPCYSEFVKEKILAEFEKAIAERPYMYGGELRNLFNDVMTEVGEDKFWSLAADFFETHDFMKFIYAGEYYPEWSADFIEFFSQFIPEGEQRDEWRDRHYDAMGVDTDTMDWKVSGYDRWRDFEEMQDEKSWNDLLAHGYKPYGKKGDYD